MSIRWGLHGGDIARIGRMDIATFASAISTIDRIETHERYNSTWLDHVASQGDSKAMSKLTEPWKKKIDKASGKPEEAKSSGAAQFQKDFGKGF